MTRGRNRSARIIVSALVFLDVNAFGQAPARDEPKGADTTAGYVDRLIDPSTLAQIADADETMGYDSLGMPRVIRIEARGAISTQGDLRKEEAAVQLSARFDTPSHGAIAIEGAIRTRPSRQTLFTLSQRGLPLDGGWFANNSIGLLNTPAIDLLRTQSRFFLPSFGLTGFATEILQPNQTQFHFATGRAGQFGGQLAPEFGKLHGNAQLAGAQWSLAPGWQTGLQFINASEMQNSTWPGSDQDTLSGQAMFAALSSSDAALRWQANFLHSRRAGEQPANGIWWDANLRAPRLVQNFGAFRLEPGLSWGHLSVNNDLQGGYYQFTQQYRAWSWHGGIDAVRSVSGAGQDGHQINTGARYRIDQRWAAGGGLTLRRTDHEALALYGYVENRDERSNSRIQFDGASDGRRQMRQVSLDRSWNRNIGSQLALGFSAGQEDTLSEKIRYTNLALSGSEDISDRVKLDANLRFNQTRGNAQRSAVSGSVALTRQINRHWALAASYFDSRGKERIYAPLDPLIAPAQSSSIPAARTMLLVLRFEERAGSSTAPLGGRAGDGAGTIVGHLYLDANENGQREAGEARAANVTVLLDNKFPVRTDNQGRFEFPLVSAGPHMLIVVPDNLPLPWTLVERQRSIQVEVRNTTNVEFGATRIK